MYKMQPHLDQVVISSKALAQGLLNQAIQADIVRVKSSDTMKIGEAKLPKGYQGVTYRPDLRCWVY